MARVLVIHTTESTSFKSTKAFFDKNPGKQPHVLFDPDTLEGHKFLHYDRPAKALRNLPGGVETNRRDGGVVQLEIVAKAAEVADEDDGWYIRLADEVWMICNEAGIPLRFPRPFVPYPASYGVKAPQRMTPAEWNACTGIVGHQHVPENDHGDPGDLNRLIPLLANDTPAQGEPMAAPDVEQAQRMLNSWLTTDRQLRPDGDWGPASTTALRDILDGASRRIRELEAALINQPAMANSEATRKLAALRSALLEVVN